MIKLLKVNDNGQFMAIGTKEGKILFIEFEKNELFNDNYELVTYNSHYDKVQCLIFSHDSKELISSSKNEILISNIKI